MRVGTLAGSVVMAMINEAENQKEISQILLCLADILIDEGWYVAETEEELKQLVEQMEKK